MYLSLFLYKLILPYIKNLFQILSQTIFEKFGDMINCS